MSKAARKKTKIRPMDKYAIDGMIANGMSDENVVQIMDGYTTNVIKNYLGERRAALTVQAPQSEVKHLTEHKTKAGRDGISVMTQQGSEEGDRVREATNLQPKVNPSVHTLKP